MPTFLGKNCQLCLPSVPFVAALLYLSGFSFGVDVDLVVSVPEFSYLLFSASRDIPEMVFQKVIPWILPRRYTRVICGV